MNKYINKVKSGDYQREFLLELERIDNIPMTRAEYESAKEKAKIIAKERAEAQNLLHRQENELINAAFRADMEIKYGFFHLPEKARQKIHSMAYERGHAYGFNEIDNCYYDVVELVLDIWTIFQEEMNKSKK